MKTIKDASYSEWLVINAQLGDTAALEQLLRLWQDRLLLYGISRLGERGIAQDALQECLISISRGIKRLRDPVAFPKWAFQIMERRCQDQLRQISRRRTVQTEFAQHIEVLQEQATDPNARDDEQQMAAVLQRLPSELSRVLRLHYLEAFSLRDIAEILEVPEGTVKSRLYYARKQLAALLED